VPLLRRFGSAVLFSIARQSRDRRSTAERRPLSSGTSSKKCSSNSRTASRLCVGVAPRSDAGRFGYPRACASQSARIMSLPGGMYPAGQRRLSVGGRSLSFRLRSRRTRMRVPERSAPENGSRYPLLRRAPSSAQAVRGYAASVGRKSSESPRPVARVPTQRVQSGWHRQRSKSRSAKNLRFQRPENTLPTG
jgi:hypothetical protein